MDAPVRAPLKPKPHPRSWAAWAFLSESSSAEITFGCTIRFSPFPNHATDEEDREVRSVIQQIAVQHRRRYGYRRVSAELRRRGCW
jgi:hypothetical protein